MRPDIDEYFLKMLELVGSRATCVKAQVGCILVNYRNHIIATGYNGVPSGFVHCIDEPCPGAKEPVGSGKGNCLAVHAEQNALLQCADVHSIKTAYVTLFPCMPCLKLLMNTSCETIVYVGDHPGEEDRIKFWLQSREGRAVKKNLGEGFLTRRIGPEVT
ncbi:dCMP deaminase family protein [Candidatus Pacearchaeota archaeon]|nr:dCMP deaminase family protein [Candidatus Pacearchaeota archaeon]